VAVPQHGQLLVRQNGVRQFQHLRLIRQRTQQVALLTDIGLEAHHQLFPDRINGRVGDLCEVLLEVVVEQLRLVAEHGERRVGAHRAVGFLAPLCHRSHQQSQIFERVAEQALQARKRQRLDRGLGLDVVQIGEADLVLAQPAPVRFGLR
jgi:hypothetical protein